MLVCYITFCKFLVGAPNRGDIRIDKTEQYKQDRRQKVYLNIIY